jgi:hypothetical protein
MLVVRVTIFARLATKQNVMKKDKYLIFDRFKKEIVLKSGDSEKQHLPRIGSLFCTAVHQ